MEYIPSYSEDTEDLFEHFAFTVDKGQQPLRIDKYLMNFVENATRNKIQAAAKSGHIFVNGAAVKSNYKVKPGDIVKVMFSHPPYENLLVGEKMDLDILFEDENLLVVNKPAGLVVHPGHGNYNGTLLNGLIYHFKNLPFNSDGRPGLVHRIDKDTSGLLVIAKDEHSMTDLAKQFYLKTSKRKYLALVWGIVADEKGTVNANLARDPKNRLIMSVPKENENFEVKSLAVGGEMLHADKIDVLAKLPTRDQALSLLASCMIAPVTKLTRTFNEVPLSITRVVAAVKEKKQGEAA